MSAPAPSLEGALCGVPACMSEMERKIGASHTKIAGKDYWVCSNFAFHSNYQDKTDPNRSPFIMGADKGAIKMHLMKLAGEMPAPVAASDGAAPAAKRTKYTVGEPLPTDVHAILVDIKNELVALREAFNVLHDKQ